jgi:hypothetical protein
MTFVCIHGPILAILTSLFVSTLGYAVVTSPIRAQRDAALAVLTGLRELRL